MGLTDLVSNVLTKYKANVSDHKAAIRGLRGEEKARHQALLAEAQAQNAGIDKQIAMYGKIGIAIGAAVGAFKLAQKAAQSYLEDVRLESAAAGINIDRLAAATRGLVEQDNLLAFAGKAQHGVWKLTEEQMVTVAKGTEVLARRMGVDLTTAMDAVTESVARGTTRGVKELGLEVKNSAEFMAAMADAASQAGTAGTTAAEEYQQASVEWKNAVDDLIGSLGKLVVALAPVVKVIAEAVQGLGWAVGGAVDLAKRMAPGGGLGGLTERAEAAEAENARNLEAVYAWDRAKKARKRLGPMVDKFIGDINDLTAKQLEKNWTESQKEVDVWLSRGLAEHKKGKSAGRAAEAAREQALRAAQEIDAILQDIAELRVKAFQDEWATAGEAQEKAKSAKLAGIQRASFARQDIFQASNERADDKHMQLVDSMAQAEAMSAQQRGGPSQLELILGTPEQINAQNEAISLLAGTFAGFTGAMASGFDAMITGSESFSAAFKKAIAEALRALAGQMFVESLKHGAMAIGAAAMFNYKSAGEHAIAAGLFASGAVAAGVVANQMGAGGRSMSASGGHASAGGGGSRAANVMGTGPGGANGGGNVTNITLGADFYDLTVSERQALLARAVKKGQRNRSSNVIQNH